MRLFTIILLLASVANAGILKYSAKKIKHLTPVVAKKVVKVVY